jgi:formylglycine-generating enzyme required for sulfatase activity
MGHVSGRITGVASGVVFAGAVACTAPGDATIDARGGTPEESRGGSSPMECTKGQKCNAAAECASGVCVSGVCRSPTANDGVKNGDESDVDCGGSTTSAPRCAAGRSCTKHADCASDGCDETKHCAVGRSCTQLDGGRTCGASRPHDEYESCCESLPIPGRVTRLDKYKVTAGRMRAFVERVNGDVRGWYEANRASLSAAAREQIEPHVSFLPRDRTSPPYGSDLQLGGTIYLVDRPGPEQGCFVGDAAHPGNGSHTFWNGDLEGDDRGFDRKFLDRLPLNCVPYPLAAAFCAWDGGRLQTFDENEAAYGSNPYPWGASPAAGGYDIVNGVWTLIGPATDTTFSKTPCPSCDPTRMNWHHNYQMPSGGNAAKPWDFAYWISPPGRFSMDAGPGGHRDIAGLMMELTATVNGVDEKYAQPMVRWSRAGSWEGHPVDYPKNWFAIMTKYGKLGLRCAHD